MAAEAPKRPSGRSRTAAKAAVAPPQDPPVQGRVGAAVSALVDSLDLDGDHPRLALAAVAEALAREIDAGAGMAAAAMAKELRATLAELGGEGDDDDDAFAEWERQLGSAT